MHAAYGWGNKREPITGVSEAGMMKPFPVGVGWAMTEEAARRSRRDLENMAGV